MSNRSIQLDDDLYDYLVAHSLREPEILSRLRKETAELPESMMQIAPEQGQFMALLSGLIGARNYLEIGTFTGYSALAVCLALPPDGQVVACDVSERFTSLGRRFWEEAGVAERIDLRLAPAVETLDALVSEGKSETFDFAFIDADKENYDAYYERALALLRQGGLIAVDNVLWDGSVVNPEKQDADTNAIRALNKKIHEDKRVDISLVPIGDGLTLARKR